LHLKSVTIKGFKSFPERTRLRFGEGVSVIVGPNGSGKSNITDAVLWALGEQSPLAVRGQSMQDVIFAGGRGVQARSEAEVELVLDNSDELLDIPANEIAITRTLNRAGEGGYRINGARCRLVDVLELLSDTGLGKEAHSVISQGRVEAIVTSKPRDRRLLIEEAAGLGKHRKRRRRAQLKLDRAAENLDRALDIEREARARLRPLKRQAEAAELHERLERQVLEARWTVAGDELRERRLRLADAERIARERRASRDALGRELAAVAERRAAAETALAERSKRHEGIAGRVFTARSAHDRVRLRAERARELAETLARRAARRSAELAQLRDEPAELDDAGTARVEQLEAQIAELERERQAHLEGQLRELEAALEAARGELRELDRERAAARELRDSADAAVISARGALHEAEQAVERARRDAARVGAELAAVNQFLRSHGAARGRGEALEQRIQVAPGYELALAAALGGARLGSLIASDRGGASALLDRAGEDGGRALVADAGAAPGPAGAPPVAGAQRLIELIGGDADALAVLTRLLATTWVVEDIAAVPTTFTGVSVTRSGRVWDGLLGELTQAASGAAERALEQRNRRDALVAEAETAARVEYEARAGAADAQALATAALEAREAAELELRAAERAHGEAQERERLAGWLIEQRRAAPDAGELAVRRAELEGELSAERRAIARVERERVAHARRRAMLERLVALDGELTPRAERLGEVLRALGDALEAHLGTIEGELAADSAAGEALAGQLRECTATETVLQARLQECADALTLAEVGAQQARDRVEEAGSELRGLAERLGLAADAPAEPLPQSERDALAERIARLTRRREQLGPVNPLAGDEYKAALEHANELEAQRADLETAIRELTQVIRDADRQISESFNATFEAAAQNFEELIEDVFPGGSGRLRLVRDDSMPRPVLGGQAQDTGDEASAEREAVADEARAEGEDVESSLGVEIELTPAGKSMKRLSLLSGGEKSMTAIAFLFAVFLARPCPFYILDEVEAALDDLNIDRFLALLRRHSTRAQFIVVTHQKRTMEAADWLYGVSMGGDGVSKVISRRLGETGLHELEPAAPDGAAPVVRLARADAA
jgi:chromosome segregation protein